MTRHGGDHVAEALAACGVPFVFTLCGGHISPILSAAKARDIRVVDVRHEATAVFAADAVARLTGTPGVAAVTAGPGATNTLTAVKNAELAQSPVVLLVGAAPTVLEGRGALQDIDQAALFEPHVKTFTRVRRARDLGAAVVDAMAVAGDGVPGPVAVECPVDLLYAESIVKGWYTSKSHTGKSLKSRMLALYLERHVKRMFAGADAAQTPTPRQVRVPAPAAHTVAGTAKALATAEHPVLMVGSQALADAGNAAQVADAVRRLGIPVYLSGMARGLLGPADPLQMRQKRRDALREADVVILAGVPCDFRLDYGRQIRGSSFFVSANRSRRDLKRNRRPDLAAHGDAGKFLIDLAGRVQSRTSERWAPWTAKLRARNDEREGEIIERASVATDFLNPLALCRRIEDKLADDAVLVADGGDFVATASYILRPRGPLSWLDPGVFGTLGVGAGFALGAKLCRPESDVWLIYGDGAAGYSLAEFDTFVRHGLPVIAVVGNDAGWTQIAREQVEILKDDVACTLRRTDYHDVAAGFGGRGLHLDDPAATTATLDEALRLAHDGHPVLVNALLGKTDFRKGSISM